MKSKRSGVRSGKEFTVGGFTRKDLKEIRVKAVRSLGKDNESFEILVSLIRAVRYMEDRLVMRESLEIIREREARKRGSGKARK